MAEAHQLQTDDSALTGEKLGISKDAGGTIFAGTTVTGGRAQAVVTTTGAASTLGRIESLMASARPGPTPLQRRLPRLGQQLTIAAVTISGVVTLLAVLRGLSWGDAALPAASLAVAALPKSLPAVLTLSLALGAHRMARHASHASIARELRALETLGSVTLLATDKTGWLTQNRMVSSTYGPPPRPTTSSAWVTTPAGAITSKSGRPAGSELSRPRVARDAPTPRRTRGFGWAPPAR